MLLANCLNVLDGPYLCCNVLRSMNSREVSWTLRRSFQVSHVAIHRVFDANIVYCSLHKYLSCSISFVHQSGRYATLILLMPEAISMGRSSRIAFYSPECSPISYKRSNPKVSGFGVDGRHHDKRKSRA